MTGPRRCWPVTFFNKYINELVPNQWFYCIILAVREFKRTN